MTPTNSIATEQSLDEDADLADNGIQKSVVGDLAQNDEAPGGSGSGGAGNGSGNIGHTVG